MRSLKELLKDRKDFKNFTLFYDIETLTYNKVAGRETPREYKSMTYAVGVSWIDGDGVEYEIFPNFKKIFDTIIEVYAGLKHKPKIFLNAHNSNKFDNHFLRRDLIYYYNARVENFYLTTATTDEGNKNSVKIKQLKSKEDKDAIILEKRIKTSINLELTFFLKGIQFETVDNWVKTNSSIDMLGKKLLKIGVVAEDELKTDINYTQFDKEEDMSEEDARDYVYYVFLSLSFEMQKYIRNDVILLAKSVYYYSDLFNGFDYSKRTFTSNILESYNTNFLTSFQLLNTIGTGKEKQSIRYTDYQFANENFYDYLKPFYRGGLNFYNQNFIGRIITDGVFSMDIHSSYPYAMHNFKIPTYLKNYESFEEETFKEIIHDDDEYTLYRMSRKSFDEFILDRIESMVLRQLLVKYYTTNDFININSYTFKMIENVTGIQIHEVPIYSYVTFDCEYFGSREEIERFYKIKTQGKHKKKLKFESPYNIYETDEVNTDIYTPEEVDNSKVNLNGLYGIPALRPYFNLFRRNEEGELFNIENGHSNQQRNIVFSIFVTSVSLWNLLNPLKYLTAEEIDNNFLYCDTDSLYFKQTMKEKLPPSLFTQFALGTWDIELDNAKYFYILNHKKYCYQVNTTEKIQVRSGGISHQTFNRDLDFKTFINTQFSDGCEITQLKSIYNKDETISIYPSKTLLEKGRGYRIRTHSKKFEQMKQEIIEEMRAHETDFTNDIMYVESVLGTFSYSDLYPVTHEVKKKHTLPMLKVTQKKFKNIIDI